MLRRFLIPLSLFFLLIAAGLTFSHVVIGAEENQDINVQYNVPSAPSGGGDSTPPIISNVSTSASYTTATVAWVAIDNLGSVSCYFDYGLTSMYGSSAPVSISGSNFTVNLSGLATGTLYYFLISCVDGSSNMSTYNGTFTTLSPFFLNNLIILGKPEKRVPKPGGNLSLDSAVLFYNPVSHALVHTLNITLDNSGSSTVAAPGVPVGNYDAVLKGQSHLAKKIINVNIVDGATTTLDFTESGAFYLLAGDVQGTGLKDNFVDILDISAVDVRFNSTNLEADLNRDGIVDVLDMSIVLVNYNKPGDPI